MIRSFASVCALSAALISAAPSELPESLLTRSPFDPGMLAGLQESSPHDVDGSALSWHGIVRIGDTEIFGLVEAGRGTWLSAGQSWGDLKVLERDGVDLLVARAGQILRLRFADARVLPVIEENDPVPDLALREGDTRSLDQTHPHLLPSVDAPLAVRGAVIHTPGTHPPAGFIVVRRVPEDGRAVSHWDTFFRFHPGQGVPPGYEVVDPLLVIHTP